MKFKILFIYLFFGIQITNAYTKKFQKFYIFEQMICELEIWKYLILETMIEIDSMIELDPSKKIINY